MFHKSLDRQKTNASFRNLFMKTTLTVLAVAALAGSVASAAEISGKVKLNGTPPPEKKIPLDALCAKTAPGGLSTRHFVTSADSGLANVFVYVKEGAKSTPAPSQKGALLDQINCEYVPS
jgi:hypothetical protein